MAIGECNCGAVSFEISSKLTDVYVCHCSICRRATGANGIAVVVFNSSDFHWLAGEDQISHWSKPDADWHISFCKTCGSPLPAENDDDTMFAPAGLIIEGGHELTVKAHMFVGSKAHWHEIGGSAPQFPERLSQADST